MQKQFDTNIKEIFTSIQGEGTHIGEKHTFVRFCSCNLACGFCDTDFSNKNSKKYSIQKLYEELSKTNSCAVSFTGGEPLLEADFLYNFLKKYKTKLNKKIYLETNGTLYQNLAKIIDFIDIVAMDIKIKSATGQKNNFSENEKFIEIASKKETIIKIVFDKNIENDEINFCSKIAKKYDVPLILQPKMPLSKNFKIEEIFEKFYTKYQNTRLIAQMHKFLNLA